MSILIGGRAGYARSFWTPKLLSSLKVWLDADDASTITTATGVSEWRGKSGNSEKFTQATGSAQPTVVANGQNSRSIVRFNGTSQRLEGGPVLTAQNNFSIGAVLKPSSDSEMTWFASGYGGQAGFGAKSLQSTVANTGHMLTKFGVVNIYSGYKPGQVATLVVWTVETDNKPRLYGNGTLQFTATDTSTFKTATSAAFVGSTSRSDELFAGDIMELMYLNTALSTADRQKLEGYLAHKWGLQSSLPGNHPYKTGAP